MGCTFCATGTMGFKSNLTSGEIVEQLVHASRISPIRNVVFMVSALYFSCVFSYCMNVTGNFGILNLCGVREWENR